MTNANPSSHATGQAVSSARIRFFDRQGYANVRHAFDDLFASATQSLRAAACFLTQPGALVVRPHAARLRLPDSFIVASVDWPTNLKALKVLHELAPGHVFIHLGGTTPNEKNVTRSLMHSKLFLASGDGICRLWVGSHNLTASAVLGGNIEAGIEISAPANDSSIQDAIAHLEVCRATAELFDPNQMGRYREIQLRRLPKAGDFERLGLLIVHAEAAVKPTRSPFNAHIRLVPICFDSLFRPEGGVRLFLHQPGRFKPGVEPASTGAELWHGEITAVVRTDRHPRNRGIPAQFPAADFDIDLPDEQTPPVFVQAGRSSTAPCTQVVVRCTQQGQIGDEVYSVDSNAPAVDALDTANAVLKLHEVEHEMLRFFTRDSYDAEQSLLFRPVQGVKRVYRVTGFSEDSPQFPGDEGESAQGFTVDNPKAALGFAEEEFQYHVKKPQYEVQPFFYRTTYVIYPKKALGNEQDGSERR